MSSDISVAGPIDSFLQAQGLMILDGGLATELEARGCDLSDDLWSARVLMDEPDLIRDVHLDYLRAGADCVVSASYQATFEGFAKRGLTRDESSELLGRSVELAREARDLFWADRSNRRSRLRPLVAASIGPYGAYLADGSEFRGDYDLNEEELEEFHRARWEILTSCGADLMACETLPSRSESRALLRLLRASHGVHAWFSFSCGSESQLHDGSPIDDVAAELEGCSRIVAVGINCTPPRFISGLVERVLRGTSKPVMVYPNSGEPWDADSRTWQVMDSDRTPWFSHGGLWVQRGARILGGCCRTRPAEITALRASLLS